MCVYSETCKAASSRSASLALKSKRSDRASLKLAFTEGPGDLQRAVQHYSVNCERKLLAWPDAGRFGW